YGADSFTWKGNDGNAYSANIATMSVTIVAVNDLPTVGNKTKAGAEDTVLQLEAADFTGVYADADNDLLRSVKIVRLPANGTLHLDGAAVKTGQEIPVTELAKLTFLPEQDWNGTDSVEWLGFDGTAYSATAATFSFDVNPVNDAPVAQNAMLTVTEGQQKQGRLDASDVEGDSLTFAVVIQPSKGTLTLDPNTGEFTYKPNRNERGKDTFTYKVNDGALDSTAATVTISITSLPPPITSNDANLSALRIAGGTLEPSFSAERTDYKLVLDQGVTEITVTPTTAHWAATVKVNGTPVMSGHASQPIKLERDQIRIDVTVTAMDGTQKTYTIVTGSQNVPIEKIVLDKTRVTMTEGDRPLVLTATVYPAEAQEVALQWTSSNPKIASVDQNGKVVPNGKGTATITVSTPDGKVKATSRITVKAGKPIALLADPLMLVMSPKETESLHIDAFFGYETKRDVTDEVVWKSEDSKIASVSAKGIVRAKKAGTTRIIASYKGMETAILVRVYEHKWVDERDITVSFTPNRTGSQFKLVVKGKLLEEDGLGVTVKVGKASYKAKMDKDGQSFSFQRTLKWKGELPQSIELRVSSDAKEEQVITLPLQLFDPEDVQLEKNKLNGTVFDRTLIANMEAVTEEGEHFYATWEENRFEIKLPATVTGKITLRATAFSGLQQEWEVKN
ncbi:MAG: tandem-95 repeat protein, partial [Clostridia bacterium]